MSMNYRATHTPPKPFLEINRNEEVPRLISIKQYTNAPNKNIIHKTVRNNRFPTHKALHEKSPEEEIYQLTLLLENERNQNEEMKDSIKELTVKMEKLREVNQNLIARIKEVEHHYRELRSELDREHYDSIRKLKTTIYDDIELYIKSAIKNFKESLQNQKMNPRIQQKAEIFMEEILQINSISVQNFGKRERLENLSAQNKLLAQNINDLIEKQSKSPNKWHSRLESNSPGPTKSQYTSLMNHLTEIKKQERLEDLHMSQGGRLNQDRFNSLSKENNLRSIYATTPQKRRKIFQ